MSTTFKTAQVLTTAGRVYVEGSKPPRQLPKGTRVVFMSHPEEGKAKVRIADPENQYNGQRAIGPVDAFARRYRGRPRADGQPLNLVKQASDAPIEPVAEAPASAEAESTEEATDAAS